MRKDALKFILKELKKNSEITIIFKPTLEECDYLFSNGWLEDFTIFALDN